MDPTAENGRIVYLIGMLMRSPPRSKDIRVYCNTRQNRSGFSPQAAHQRIGPILYPQFKSHVQRTHLQTGPNPISLVCDIA